jgi:hypothetical protein
MPLAVRLSNVHASRTTGAATQSTRTLPIIFTMVLMVNKVVVRALVLPMDRGKTAQVEIEAMARTLSCELTTTPRSMLLNLHRSICGCSAETGRARLGADCLPWPLALPNPRCLPSSPNQSGAEQKSLTGQARFQVACDLVGCSACFPALSALWKCCGLKCLCQPKPFEYPPGVAFCSKTNPSRMVDA